MNNFDLCGINAYLIWYLAQKVWETEKEISYLSQYTCRFL